MIAGLETALAAHGLFVMGALHDSEDTVVLFGADAAMWPVFTESTEYLDGRADPLDRWSKRLIGELAGDLGAEAVFPSDGPPYAPFIAWAMGTGRFWQSPTGMMVHDVAGLMISIRGALRVPGLLELPEAVAASPCSQCADRPCVPACPVDALSEQTDYDVPKCKAHLGHEAGRTCVTGGCLVRRACPVSQSFERDPAQSAFHMRAFVRA